MNTITLADVLKLPYKKPTIIAKTPPLYQLPWMTYEIRKDLYPRLEPFASNYECTAGQANFLEKA